jgi:NAD(P)-dependent dehydrogenase (short-subunit alcohol dehydrogenase family)
MAKITNNTTTPNVEIVTTDLGTKAGCQALIDKVSTSDILINNLGPYYESDFLGSDADDKLLTLFETNVMSATRLSKHYLKNMLSQNSGRIIFIGSDAAIKVPSNMIDHAIVKAGALALKNGLAELTRHANVTVNAVIPGPTMTEGVEEYFKGRDMTQETGNLFANECNASILQRWATPAEVASLVTYVASPLSIATNGASLRADGGVLKIL